MQERTSTKNPIEIYPAAVEHALRTKPRSDEELLDAFGVPNRNWDGPAGGRLFGALKSLEKRDRIARVPSDAKDPENEALPHPDAGKLTLA